MCGRFTQVFEDWSFMLDYFDVSDTSYRLPPLYNAAPTQDISAIVADGKQRRIGKLRWGIVPSWSDSVKTSFQTFNARVETITMKPAFRGLLSHRRCIIPADGFYEWHKHNKIPYRIRVEKQPVFGIAGLYDIWNGPKGERVGSCTMITCEPNFFMSSLHDRMPVILDEDGVELWLNRKEIRKKVLTSILKPYSGDMYKYEVDTMVGDVKNDLRKCIEPVAR